jgi:hypothetical protein
LDCLLEKKNSDSESEKPDLKLQIDEINSKAQKSGGSAADIVYVNPKPDSIFKMTNQEIFS